MYTINWKPVYGHKPPKLLKLIITHRHCIANAHPRLTMSLLFLVLRNSLLIVCSHQRTNICDYLICMKIQTKQ